MFWYPLFAYLFALGYYFQQTDDLGEENVVSYTEKQYLCHRLEQNEIDNILG